MNTNSYANPGWNFDNSYARLPGTFYTRVNPEKAPAPELVIINEGLAESLGLNPNILRVNGAAVLSGAELPEGAASIAQAYGGHQFGYFTMLGDGRAVLIGEQLTPRRERFDIQLKGSGRTPYSRGGDGKAVLGPMLREYIISEAMFNLGIPTTRSLAVTLTGEKVLREGYQKGAVLTRVASSHIRVGTFQYAAAYGSLDDLKALADYTINRHFSELGGADNKYLALLSTVIRKQAELISKWMLVGFIHGVMNTDNMALSGETIDYGPCAFMDVYEPETVFSSIDTKGRYAYGNQPEIGGWNLARFAETLLPLIDRKEDKALTLAQDEINRYFELYHEFWLSGMRDKLGIFNKEEGDRSLIYALLDIMHKNQADYTNTFLALTYEEDDYVNLREDEDFQNWYTLWQSRLTRQDNSKEASHKLMRSSNPALIPRNYYVEEALSAADRGDFDVMHRLLEALSDPYAHRLEQAAYSCPPLTGAKYKTYCGT